MANYVKQYDGIANDQNSATIYGADFDSEFQLIESASATKADKVLNATLNNLSMLDASGNLVDSGVTTDGAGLLTNDVNAANITATNLSVTNTITGSISGNAATASKWLNARTLTVTGDMAGSVTFDGSANVSLDLQLGTDSVGSAQIVAGNVGASEVADGSMRFSNEMQADATAFTWSTDVDVYVPKGVYLVYSLDSDFVIKAFVNGAWQFLFTGGTGSSSLIISNGASVKYTSLAGISTGYATRIFV